VRIVAAFTRVNWHYPDEWYQTVEFSRLLLGQTATYSHEMSRHLRNLSWPLALCIPLKLADWIAPHWTHLRLIFAQLFSGGLDLLAIWSFSRLSKKWNPLWRNIGFALLVLPWFQVQDSVSLGIEHLSVCVIWITLALIESESFFSAGILAIGIFAAKYPAGLVTAGLSIAFAIKYRSQSKSVFRFSAGLLAGVLIFGIPDWIFYGRPWESFWMYLQYNVLTSAGSEAFGAQSVFAYFDFFQSRWLHVLAPLGIAFVLAGGAGLFRDLKRVEPWAWAFAAYLIGHLLISHREPRFMFPAEALLLWGALKYLAEKYPDWHPKKWMKIGFAFVFLANLPLFLKAGLAETGTLNSSYFSIDQHLRETPNVCAVISQRLLNSLLIPGNTELTSSPPSSSSSSVGKPAYAYFTAIRRLPTFPQTKTQILAWYSELPHCSASDSVLLLVDHPDVTWVEKGCKLQRSGVLQILPQSLWLPVLRRGWVSGPWYACQSAILSEFSNPVQEDTFIHELPKIASLPPLGASTEEIVSIGKNARSAHCKWACP
jgi:hypothetical protein